MDSKQKVRIELGERTRIDLPEEKKFGTFHGVFRPTILTIIGVMLYLREGWLVGNAGLVGAILVILTAYLITGTTALSISSITCCSDRVGGLPGGAAPVPPAIHGAHLHGGGRFALRPLDQGAGPHPGNDGR